MLVKNESLKFGLTCFFISKKDPEIDEDSDEETLMIK